MLHYRAQEKIILLNIHLQLTGINQDVMKELALDCSSEKNVKSHILNH